MPIDPVKIPQNVYIEDRIVGPLTLRQTLIMALSGGFSYALYSSLVKAYGGNPGAVLTAVCFFPFLIGVAFALIKINDLSLLRIVLLMIERTNKPSVRTWALRRGITISISTGKVKEEDPAKQEAAKREAESKAKRIQELSSTVDAPFGEPPGTSMADTPERVAEPSPAPRFPVDPTRISVDGTAQGGQSELSDLSIFRDIFPKS